jgi:hypothetical protein
MTTFPGSPRVLKGALVSYELPSTQPSVIVFQYNPGTLSRSLQARGTDTGGGRSRGPLRLKGAPVETITLEVAVDAADQLEKEDAQTLEKGIHPQLAALEILVYPPSQRVIANLGLLAAGFIEIVPPEAPFTLFVYGPGRVLPVKLGEVRVTEEAHDVQLNPIRAKVNLNLQVLSYCDFAPDHPGHALFLAHQLAKEALAKIGASGSLDAVGADIHLP